MRWLCAQYIQLFNPDYTLLEFKENMILFQEPRSRTCLAVFEAEARGSRVTGPDQGTQPRTFSTRPSPPALRGRRGCRAPRFSRSPYQPPHSARCLDSSQTIQGTSASKIILLTFYHQYFSRASFLPSLSELEQLKAALSPLSPMTPTLET